MAAVILDKGPDEVLIWPEIEVLDDSGSPVRIPSATPVSISTYVQALSATESADYDIDPRTSRYFNTSQALPGGAWARVSWGGREWDVVGEPQRLGRTHRTARTHVVITARTPREAPDDQ